MSLEGTGVTRCVMDGTYVTGVRTAAAAALSTRLLARADAKVATIVGAGVQAREHLRVLPLVRGFERINICSLVADDAHRLAEQSPLAVGSTDVRAAIESSDSCASPRTARPP